MKKILLLLLFSALNNIAFSFCPPEISVAQKEMSSYPGWRAYASIQKHFLTGVTLYAGKPEAMASLRPEEKNHQRIWEFSPGENIYLTCSYHKTTIELTQALPSKTTKCILQLSKTLKSEEGSLPEKLICQ